MRYLVELVPDGDGFAVSCPDIPEALTCGDSREEALAMARDALMTALDFYFEDEREVPAPRPVPPSADAVELPADLAAKVLQLNERVQQRGRPHV